jgi:hypothetical protein
VRTNLYCFAQLIVSKAGGSNFSRPRTGLILMGKLTRQFLPGYFHSRLTALYEIARIYTALRDDSLAKSVYVLSNHRKSPRAVSNPLFRKTARKDGAPAAMNSSDNVVCLPAGSTTTVGRDLSRPYVDDNRVPFQSVILSAYDFFNGIDTFTPQTIINALNSNNPLLYCNTQHAMIVYSVTYISTPNGPNIQTVQVVDPWPFNPRFHSLTPPEIVTANFGGQMTFLAEVKLI